MTGPFDDGPRAVPAPTCDGAAGHTPNCGAWSGGRCSAEDPPNEPSGYDERLAADRRSLWLSYGMGEPPVLP